MSGCVAFLLFSTVLLMTLRDNVDGTKCMLFDGLTVLCNTVFHTIDFMRE